MQSEKINATDNSGASLICGNQIEESANATGVYTVTCVGADGQVKWADTFNNTVVTVGKALLLNAMFAGTTPITTWCSQTESRPMYRRRRPPAWTPCLPLIFRRRNRRTWPRLVRGMG